MTPERIRDFVEFSQVSDDILIKMALLGLSYSHYNYHTWSYILILDEGAHGRSLLMDVDVSNGDQAWGEFLAGFADAKLKGLTELGIYVRGTFKAGPVERVEYDDLPYR